MVLKLEALLRLGKLGMVILGYKFVNVLLITVTIVRTMLVLVIHMMKNVMRL
jgi:hypothetical protein